MKMLTCIPRIALTCIASVCAAVSLPAFEGKVVMNMTVGKNEKPVPMTYYIKGTHIRTETVMADKHEKTTTVAAIIDGEKREMITLMAEQKAYMVHKLPEAKEHSDVKESDQPEFKATGRKEVIAGMEAEEYISTSKKRVTELWVTKDLGQMIMANQGKGGPGKGGVGGAWQKFAEQNNLFALRVVERLKADGPEEMRMEVVKIQAGPQPDSLFAPPSDYKKFEMPSMGDMMKGMMPGH